MKHKHFLSLLLCSFCCVAVAQQPQAEQPQAQQASAVAKKTDPPSISIPEKIEIEEANDPRLVNVTTNGRIVRWFAATRGLRVITKDVETIGDNKAAYVWGNPGTYRLGCYTAVADIPSEPVYSTIIVAGTPTPGPSPGPVPVTPPSPELRSALAPVIAVMAVADRAKASQFAAIWSDFLLALNANPPETQGAFESAIVDFLNAAVAKAGLGGAFPGFSAALDAAINSYFGEEDSKLDAAKAAAFVSGIIWSCGGAQ